jgi:hypothetical protein
MYLLHQYIAISILVYQVIAFPPQLVKYVVQLVFLCWGIFLCCTFLYGGYRVMGLLRNMPGGLLRHDPPDHQQKGMLLPSHITLPLNNSINSRFVFAVTEHD